MQRRNQVKPVERFVGIVVEKSLSKCNNAVANVLLELHERGERLLGSVVTGDALQRSNQRGAQPGLGQDLHDTIGGRPCAQFALDLQRRRQYVGVVVGSDGRFMGQKCC